MNIKRNIIVDQNSGRKLLLDAYALDNRDPKPIVVFAHGFKGFKDWGIWDLIAQHFAKAGFAFFKFNFSHNGTSIDSPLDFTDLEAFGQNNYTKELADLDAVLNGIERGDFFPREELDFDQLSLIGHSRGGGTTAIKAAMDTRITSWIGWASVKDLAYAWRNKEELLKNWKATGVLEIKNGRTGQMMPLNYQLLEDFEEHEKAYDLASVIQGMQKPMLVIHGTSDPAVPVAVTEDFARWNEKLEVHLIDGADHVFGGSHPYASEELPLAAQELVAQSISFFKRQTS